MKIHLISIFPEIFQSFLNTSLIAKAQEKEILEFNLVNPRDFCTDKHQQIDDEIYGGGAGMLIKAQPIIDSVESVIKTLYPSTGFHDDSGLLSVAGGQCNFKIIFLSPSDTAFNQKIAHNLSQVENLIFVCGRYEGIDYRFEQHMQKKYPDQFIKISLGKFITLGGELPAMTMIESITRLIPGVIKEELSWQDESYSVDSNMDNLEYPQYTRPVEVEGIEVPEVLLSGHHAEIEKWRKEQTGELDQ